MEKKEVNPYFHMCQKICCIILPQDCYVGYVLSDLKKKKQTLMSDYMSKISPKSCWSQMQNIVLSEFFSYFSP